jgi:RNA polymerase sigma-70 factor (ECF subfamily)
VREDEFRRLFDENYDYVWSSLRRLGVQLRDLEDLTHEVFIEVHAKLDRYDRCRPIRPWLFAFALRFASDYRKLARHTTELRDETEAPANVPSAEELVATTESAVLLRAALDGLSLELRAVIVLYEIDETPMKEIAETLGIPLYTGYSRLRLAPAVRRDRKTPDERDRGEAMSDDQLEPIDEPLAALFRDERARGHAPEGAKRRAFERLERAVGSPRGTGIETANAVVSRARLLPLVGALLVGGVLGVVVGTTSLPPRIVYVDRVVMPVAAAPSPAAPVEIGSAASTSLAPSASTAVAPSSASDKDTALARERMVLDVARTALGRGDGARALEAVNRHAKEFPRGQMSEEREAIAVQALAKLGRTDDAAARGIRFRNRYPNSVLGPVVDAALESAGAEAAR